MLDYFNPKREVKDIRTILGENHLMDYTDIGKLVEAGARSTLRGGVVGGVLGAVYGVLEGSVEYAAGGALFGAMLDAGANVGSKSVAMAVRDVRLLGRYVASKIRKD